MGKPVLYDSDLRELIIEATDKDHDENGRVSYSWTGTLSLLLTTFYDVRFYDVIQIASPRRLTSSDWMKMMDW